MKLNLRKIVYIYLDKNVLGINIISAIIFVLILNRIFPFLDDIKQTDVGTFENTH